MYNFVKIWYDYKGDGHSKQGQKEVAMKTVISLIVSALFAQYTGADFNMLFVVTLASIEVFDYLNDNTDDKNALH